MTPMPNFGDAMPPRKLENEDGDVSKSIALLKQSMEVTNERLTELHTSLERTRDLLSEEIEDLSSKLDDNIKEHSRLDTKQQLTDQEVSRIKSLLYGGLALMASHVVAFLVSVVKSMMER